MRSSYKPLGKYIREVDVRNTTLEGTNLLGVSIQKVFMPSIANTIGTDMSTYKIVKRNQLAYGPVTSRNGGKISVALLSEHDEAIVSQAYTTFEVIDTETLHPEYLMMWFRRPEFDRYARFMSHGSAREIFGWEEMCNTLLPVPSPDKQREIVAEYNTIQNRIDLNRQLIAKLEEAAQAIYRRWFVEFEFPNDEGKPYKSSGGEMVYNKELQKEIPKGWGYEKIGTYVKLSQGLVMNATTSYLIKHSGIPLLRITDLINDTQEIFIDETIDKKYLANKEDIIVTRTGQVGLVFRNKVGVIYNNCFKIIPVEAFIKKDYLFRFLKREETYNLMVELASGSSAQFDLTHSSFNTIQILIPSTMIQEKFSSVLKPIETFQIFINTENQKLSELKDLLLSKLATVEN